MEERKEENGDRKEGEHEACAEELPRSKMPSLACEAFREAFGRFPGAGYARLLTLLGCTLTARQSGCSSRDLPGSTVSRRKFKKVGSHFSEE